MTGSSTSRASASTTPPGPDGIEPPHDALRLRQQAAIAGLHALARLLARQAAREALHASTTGAPPPSEPEEQ